MHVVRLILSSILVLLLLGVASCSLFQDKDYRPSQIENVDEDKSSLDLEYFKARYKVAPVHSTPSNEFKFDPASDLLIEEITKAHDESFLSFSLPSDESLLLSEMPIESFTAESFTAFSGVGYSPILETQRDFIGHLIDLNQGVLSNFPSLFEPFKKLDDFPYTPRFSGPEYDNIRLGFSKCSRSAREANNMLSGQLVFNSSTNFIINDYLKTIKEYEKDCLYTIDRVPDSILRVSGLLLYYNSGYFDGTKRDLVPFCSATAVGENLIVTAKHCFLQLDGTDYHPLSTKKLLKEGLVYFTPLSEEYNKTYIPVNSSDELKNEAFKANEDIIRLETSKPIKDFISPVKLEPGLYSKELYIVGNTDLISNLDPQDIYGRVRASIPSSCALVEVTQQGCVYHTCQTGKSTSGAGLIAIDEENRVSLLGVHNGPIGSSQSCETEAGYNEIKNDNLNQGIIPL